MELELICYTLNGERHPLVADIAEDASVLDLRAALNAELGPRGSAVSRLYLGAEFLPDSTPIASAGLTHGAVLGVGLPAVTTESAPPDWEVAVVGGMHGGLSVPVRAGAAAQRITVGRGAGSDLPLPDREVSRNHAVISVREAGDGGLDAEIVSDGARNGVWHEGTQLTAPHCLAMDSPVGIGESRLVVRRVPAADADLSAEVAQGGWLFNRPPRIQPTIPAAEVIVPVRPVKPERFRLPWLGVALPMLVGLAVFLLVPNAGYWLLLTALSPVLAVVNMIGDQHGGRRAYRRRLKEFQRAHDRFTATLGEHVARDAVRRRAAEPDPAWLVRVAGAPSARLWERRPRDPDFLVLRIGLHDAPAGVVLTPDPLAPPADTAGFTLPALPLAHDVPVTVDLRAVQFLGVAGTRWTTSAAARAMVARCAALHAPSELAIMVIAEEEHLDDWEWASWLPHTRTSAEPGQRTVVAAREAADMLTALMRRLSEQQADPHRPAVLLVLDGAARLRRIPSIAAVLREGPALGVHGLCLTTDAAALPAECGAVLSLSPAGTRATLDVHGAESVHEVLVDGLSPHTGARLGRSLAPLWISGTRAGARDLPDQVRFTELAGLTLRDDPDVDSTQVMARWAAAPDHRTCRGLLGTGADGPLVVDLTKDGPHGLIVGTTGSGKSELLRTLVLSLALGNPPDALTFMLVDFKGGSAFAECADLPHCVGMVTDLDEHLVHRVLTSLSAELRRREGLLAAANAPDVESYWARTGGSLPRLVVVIDEFATLIETIPDFVPRVIDISRRARSLGVHLLLATQHPSSGVVTDDLRANLTMRVSLRVAEAAHSTELLGVPDAARIAPRQQGRAFLRTGSGTPTLFQVAGVSLPHGTDRAGGPAVVVRCRQDRTPTAGTADGTPEGAGTRTDMSVLVAAIRAASARAGIAEPARPWLPPLPDVVMTDDIAGETATGVAIGVVDQPSVPAQGVFELDLAATGPVVIAGTNRTGRSTVLRTLAAQLAAANPPHAVHVYGIDCGGRALRPLTALPHVGAVVGTDEPDRVRRLVEWLDAEVRERQDAELTGRRSTHPLVVLLVDGLQTYLRDLTDRDGGRLVDLFERLLRHGPSAGVVPVITTDRTGCTHRVATVVENRLVLRQAERDDVAAFGLPPHGLPDRMPAGRGVWTATNEEVQIAVLADDPSPSAQTEAVHRLAEKLCTQWAEVDRRLLPRSFTPLPATITVAEAEARRAAPRRTAPLVCTPAVGGDEPAPVDVDLADCAGSFVIAGAGGKGRSNALAALVHSLTGLGTVLTTALVLPRISPLRSSLSELPGVHLAPTGATLANWLTEFVETSTTPLIVVDDAELITDPAVTDQLERYVRRCRDGGAALVTAVTTDDLLLSRYRGWLAQMLRGRSGMLLSPRSTDGEAFDLRLPPGATEFPPGRGVLVERGNPTTVQVPLVVGERQSAK